MSMSPTINISLPEDLKFKIERLIEEEGYGNTSEFFRDLVRLHLKKKEKDKLEELLIRGLESGPATVFTESELEEIKERGLKRIQNMKHK